MRAATLVRRLAVVALAVLVVVPGCALGGGKDGGIRLTAYFPRAVSLFPAAQVRVLGLPAGKVKEVEAQGSRVRVVIEVADDVPVPRRVKAAIIPLSLIGERYVQLFPAWREGQPRAEDGDVIPLARTVVPVEPDEALAALKKFLDSLDPKGLGRLIGNAADTLHGNGAQLNQTLDSASELLTNFAEKDDLVVSLLAHFDELAATLRTREGQLGTVMDAFAAASGVLAGERRDIEGLVKGLGDLSDNTLDLVSEHSGRLKNDVKVLTRATQAIETNIDSVGKLLDSGPVLVKGLREAYNPDLHAIDLRDSLSPAVAEALGSVFEGLGLEPIVRCIPIDVHCPTPAEGASLRSGPGTPLDDVLGLMGSSGAPDQPSPSNAQRVGGAARSTGRFVRNAGAGMLGVFR